MDNTQYLTIRNLLDDIYRKVTNVEAEVQTLRVEVTSLRESVPPTPDLRSGFEEFKNQWEGESPDMQNLKDNLLKLKASLGGLTQVLAQQTVGEPPADQNR